MQHKFVEFIPDELASDTLYISLDYGSVVHKCCCGCGEEIVTPLSPTDWKIMFNGETVSLHPSVGNWSLPCQSHYLIKENQIVWCGKWSETQIQSGRKVDSAIKQQFFNQRQSKWQRILGWLFGGRTP